MKLNVLCGYKETLMITNFKKYIQQKKNWLYRNLYKRLKPSHFYVSPRLMASMWYAVSIGELPNLRKPRSVNELWISINLKAMKDKIGRALRIQCADKYAVRQYITDKGLVDILNECYGVFDSFEEIDFDKLPNQFVLKMTTACGMNFICKDKKQLDIHKLKELVDSWYKSLNGFGLKTAEWHYVEIKPRFIVEKYLSMLGESLSIVDYKLHCFNGQIYHIETISDRDVVKDTMTCDAYTTDWIRKDCVLPYYQKNRRSLPKPASLEYMVEVAQKLSSDFEYVRVDLYEIEGKVLFGELTFTPVGCIEHSYTRACLEDMCSFYYKTKRLSV